MENSSNKLCLSCGLCCDGSLFASAPIKKEEVNAFSDFFPELTAKETNDTKIDLPCSYLKGMKCSIYSQRPQICSSFKCSLLKKMEAGKVSFEQAIQTINSSKKMREETLAYVDDKIKSFKASVLHHYFERYKLEKKTNSSEFLKKKYQKFILSYYEWRTFTDQQIK